MYDRSFFKSKLGQAALASIAAMCAFVVLSSQMQFSPAYASAHSEIVQFEAVELA
ncbi:hypothetical protein GCM10023115_54610 [Pontixanthobacter gangjinensis]|uniref:hypothetical protein n=1 Tax=Pontixanthobacter gangjinensis TaxID=1028742 RepID=UPI0019256224|nr:hypothetical protein [Pontixanthobacter gangjinensis]